jgi:hypothetical protein
MSNRHERRKARATWRTGLAKLKTTTLNQHLENTLRRVRTEFERTGEVAPVFECMTNNEIFHVPANWPDRRAKAAAWTALRDSFRRRRVKRYVFATEAWVGKTPGLAPTDDPTRGERVLVIAVECNGSRRCASAEITRNAQTTTLGPWEISSEAPPGWLLELLEDGYSDRSPKLEPPPLERISNPDLQDLLDAHPNHRDSFKIHSQLQDLIVDQLQRPVSGNSMAIFMAMESVLRTIVQDIGMRKGIAEFARFLKDYPDKFPMFPTVRNEVPSEQECRRCKSILQRFNCENREIGHRPFVIFEAFMNMYMWLGSKAVGAVNLADRIENWDPEHQAKLREVGLRSSFELDDDEGHVFVALSAGQYPMAVMGRRNAVGDLFVSRLVSLPFADFATAVGEMRQSGAELVFGSQAKELLCKMHQVKGIALQPESMKEIWEIEEWGPEEWVQQTIAEVVFAKHINVRHLPEVKERHGNVAGYRARRATNNLVLVPSDGGEDIFVAVQVEATKRGACVLGWIRGSEGKVPQYHQNNCWVIPPEALHDMEQLPGKERLLSMPPYQDSRPNESLPEPDPDGTR